jgi:hypothetical protein
VLGGKNFVSVGKMLLVKAAVRIFVCINFARCAQGSSSSEQRASSTAAHLIKLVSRAEFAVMSSEIDLGLEESSAPSLSVPEASNASSGFTMRVDERMDNALPGQIADETKYSSKLSEGEDLAIGIFMTCVGKILPTHLNHSVLHLIKTRETGNKNI